MTSTLWWLVGAGLVIIVALGGYALWLQLRLRRQRGAQARTEARYEQKKAEHEDYLIDSIRIIAQSMVRDDLDLSEGAIRLKFLLDGLGLPDDERSRFESFDQLYHQIKHLDTHEARQNLTPKERFRQDKIRIQQEESHRDGVVAAATMLVEYEFVPFGSAGRRAKSD